MQSLRPSESARRWSALDVFRGLAVVLMIQGHTFTALLRPSEYQGPWSTWHTLLHGLTAPMFLLGGGLAYGFVLFRAQRPIGMRFLRRGALLFLLGYVLQIPKAPLSQILADRQLLAAATRVGPLQLIGACLWLCELLRWRTRSRAQLAAACGCACFAIAGGAPWVWKAHASDGALLPLANWLDGYAGSLFPFFPWAVFFFLGPPLALGVIRVLDSRRSPRTAALAFLVLGALTAASAYTLFAHGYVLRGVYGDYELWHTSPLYVLFRAGAVVGWLGCLWLAEARIHAALQRTRWFAPMFNALSKESLVAYVAHLLVLYGTPVTLGLVHLGATLSVAAVSGVAAALLLFTGWAALAYQRFAGGGWSVSVAAPQLPAAAREKPDW